MRLQRQGGHERDALEEEDDVAAVDDRDRFVDVNLVVGPLELADHPQRAAQGEQHPEDVAPPVRSPCIQQKARVGNEGNDALHEIRKR